MKKLVKLYEEFTESESLLAQIRNILDKNPEQGKNLEYHDPESESIVLEVYLEDAFIFAKIDDSTGDITTVNLNSLNIDELVQILNALQNNTKSENSPIKTPPRERLDRIMKSEKDRVEKLNSMELGELLQIADKGKELDKHHEFNETSDKREVIEYIIDNDLDLFHSI